jgi:hypothetical protein
MLGGLDLVRTTKLLTTAVGALAAVVETLITIVTDIATIKLGSPLIARNEPMLGYLWIATALPPPTILWRPYLEYKLSRVLT